MMPYPSSGLTNATCAKPSTGGSAVVGILVVEVVVVGVAGPVVGGADEVGATLAAGRAAGDITTDAIPAPAARTSIAARTDQVALLPGTRIPTSGFACHPCSRRRGGWR